MHQTTIIVWKVTDCSHTYSEYNVCVCVCVHLDKATMLLAQINRDSQGIAEFQNAGGDTQQVTLCLAEAVSGKFTFHLLVGILPSFQQRKKLLTRAVVHLEPFFSPLSFLFNRWRSDGHGHCEFAGCDPCRWLYSLHTAQP